MTINNKMNNKDNPNYINKTNNKLKFNKYQHLKKWYIQQILIKKKKMTQRQIKLNLVNKFVFKQIYKAQIAYNMNSHLNFL